jgi:hypothetical protein
MPVSKEISSAPTTKTAGLAYARLHKEKQETEVPAKSGKEEQSQVGTTMQGEHTRRVQHGGEQSGLPFDPLKEEEWIKGKYLILKMDDLIECLSDEQKETLIDIELTHDYYRISRGKEKLKGLFIRDHWPIYQTVKATLKQWLKRTKQL